MKTIGLHDDYESRGMKRSDGSSGDSDNAERRNRSSGSSSDNSKDKDARSDGSTNSQRQRKLKRTSKRTSKKVGDHRHGVRSRSNRVRFSQLNALGQSIGSSDSEQHRSDGNGSDGSMLNLNEDLKPISYYMKDRERMLQEMFRCVRGHKLQAILPDGLKVTRLDSVASRCNDACPKASMRRSIKRLCRRTSPLVFDTNLVWTNLNSHEQVRLLIDPCFRLIHTTDPIFEQHRIYYRHTKIALLF